jgi:hypothetical protein
MSGIQAAFFGMICRGAELRVAKNGTQFLQVQVRVGDFNPDFICVRTSSSGTISQLGRFLVGRPIFCEGSLFLNKKIGTDGTQKTVIDLLARYVHIAEFGRHAKRDPVPAVDRDGGNDE